MYLSNSRLPLFLLACFVVLLQACGSPPAQNKRTSAADQRSGRSPFPTREPDVYQGELVISDGTTEERYFVARDRDQWRFDVYRNGAAAFTQLRSDKVYTIDHAKRAYAVERYADLKDFDTSYFNSLSLHFFRGANYIDFEETGRDGSLVTYKARTLKDSKNDVLITVDEGNGMMVRQQITSQKHKTEQGTPVVYTFEVRGLKLDVDDDVFEIPSGYRRVAALESLPKPVEKK